MGRLACAALSVLALPGCAGSSQGPRSVELAIHHSRFSSDVVEVRAGRTVRVLIRNTDAIDHEWIVGDEDVHRRHATGTEPKHDERPTEVSVEALSEAVTSVRFDVPGDYRFVCHLPGHEAYGMSGVLRVV